MFFPSNTNWSKLASKPNRKAYQTLKASKLRYSTPCCQATGCARLFLLHALRLWGAWCVLLIRSEGFGSWGDALSQTKPSQGPEAFPPKEFPRTSPDHARNRRTRTPLHSPPLHLAKLEALLLQRRHPVLQQDNNNKKKNNNNNSMFFLIVIVF